MHQLAHWGARMMPVPTSGDLEPGWLARSAADGISADRPRVTRRVPDRRRGRIARGRCRFPGAVEDPDAVVIGGPAGFYHLVVDRDLTAVAVEGDTAVVQALLDALPPCAAEVALPRRTPRSATARRSRRGALHVRDPDADETGVRVGRVVRARHAGPDRAPSFTHASIVLPFARRRRRAPAATSRPTVASEVSAPFVIL